MHALIPVVVVVVVYIGLYLGTRTVMDMEVVGGVEAADGKETGAGEGTIVGSNTGMTETETETGTRGMQVVIDQALQTPTWDTTPIIKDQIMTIIDLLSFRCCQYS